MKMSSNDDHLNDEQILEWIEMRETINKINDETFTQKLKRKVKENPMVPFGENPIHAFLMNTFNAHLFMKELRQRHSA